MESIVSYRGSAHALRSAVAARVRVQEEEEEELRHMLSRAGLTRADTTMHAWWPTVCRSTVRQHAHAHIFDITVEAAPCMHRRCDSNNVCCRRLRCRRQ